MLGATLSTGTISDKITLQEKILHSLDYGKLYCDFKNEYPFVQEEGLDERTCYLRVEQVKKYLQDTFSIKRNPEWFVSIAVDSSILFDNVDDIVIQALSSAEIFNSFSLLRREEIELIIAGKLKNLKEITAIYTQRYKTELQILVFLNSETYDNELMYRLLDVEYDLQQQIRDPLLAFSYIPKIYENRREIVHPNANLIFERQI